MFAFVYKEHYALLHQVYKLTTYQRRRRRPVTRRSALLLLLLRYTTSGAKSTAEARKIHWSKACLKINKIDFFSLKFYLLLSHFNIAHSKVYPTVSKDTTDDDNAKSNDVEAINSKNKNCVITLRLKNLLHIDSSKLHFLIIVISRLLRLLVSRFL